MANHAIAAFGLGFLTPLIVIMAAVVLANIINLNYGGLYLMGFLAGLPIWFILFWVLANGKTL